MKEHLCIRVPHSEYATETKPIFIVDLLNKEERYSNRYRRRNVHLFNPVLGFGFPG